MPEVEEGDTNKTIKRVITMTFGSSQGVWLRSGAVFSKKSTKEVYKEKIHL